MDVLLDSKTGLRLTVTDPGEITTIIYLAAEALRFGTALTLAVPLAAGAEIRFPVQPIGEPTQLDLARQTNEACVQAARDLAASDPQVGDLVDVAIYAPGPPDTRPVGHLRGYVTAAGTGEFNVGLIDDEEDAADTLQRADCSYDDLPTSTGEIVPEGTPILENCQREWLTVIERHEAKS